MLLYIHVPFCRAKCGYCGFESVPVGARPAAGLFEGWFRLLRREMAVAAGVVATRAGHEPDGEERPLTLGEAYLGMRLPARQAKRTNDVGRPRVETAYVGGGTPSVLPVALLERLFREVRKRFELAPGAEVTCEVNPESGGRPEFFARLMRAGVNRFSLGVQSFDDRRLAALGRPHSAMQARTAFAAARSAGARNVSIDLMHDLPGQRRRDWLEELRQAVELGPEHLSCYGLTVEPQTRLEGLVESGALVLPDEDEAARMYLAGGEFLEERGWRQYEVSSFARLGRESRHNLATWRGEDYLGLGAGAVSTVTVAGKKLRWKNPLDVREWSARLDGWEQTGLPPGAEELDAGSQAREFVMLALRTAGGLDGAECRRRFGFDPFAGKAALVKALVENGLGRVRQGPEGTRLALTPRGWLTSNAIIGRFFPDSGD